MKKMMALILCILSVASLAACGKDAAKQDEKNHAQIPNPFTECKTLDEAAAISGFDMLAPDSIDGYDQRNMQAIKEEMIQVIYSNGDDSIMIRKAAGTDDCSGDYNQYDETNEVAVDEVSVTMKGNDGMVFVAAWTRGGYSYAIDVSGTGLSAEDVSALVLSID